jgi:hypothetical protein
MSLPDDKATRIARALSRDKDEFAKTHPGAPYTLGPAACCIRRVLAMEEAAEKAAAKAKRKPAKKPETATDEGWLKLMEGMDVYRHIDVRRELGKLQAWCAVRPGEQVTRRRFINWLNKAEKTIGYDARGKSSADAQKTKSNVRAGWLAVLNKLFPGSVYAKGSAFEIAEETDYAWSQLPVSVRTAIEKEMK